MNGENILIKRIEPEGDLYEQERHLRNIVLLRPIGIPDFGWEHQDQNGWHFVAVEGETVVGCVLLARLEAEAEAQLMQMAVWKEYQGKGVGAKLVRALVAFARMEGLIRIDIHARSEVCDFYLKLGFQVYGKEFEEAGIKHRHMEMRLT